MDSKSFERKTFEKDRQAAIGRLFGESKGGTFTTQDYAASYSAVISKRAGLLGNEKLKPILLDAAREQLSDCASVILVGVDTWITSDSREPD